MNFFFIIIHMLMATRFALNVEFMLNTKEIGGRLLRPEAGKEGGREEGREGWRGVNHWNKTMDNKIINRIGLINAQTTIQRPRLCPFSRQPVLRRGPPTPSASSFKVKFELTNHSIK